MTPPRPTSSRLFGKSLKFGGGGGGCEKEVFLGLNALFKSLGGKDLTILQERLVKRELTGILAMFITGSMSSGLSNRTSGIHQTQATWAQRSPLRVHFRAPPRLGQRIHFWRIVGQILQALQIQVPSGRGPVP